MKISLTFTLLMLSLTVLAQKQVNITPKITFTLPAGLRLFNDKANQESIKKMISNGNLPEAYRLGVIDFAYKKENIIVRFFAGKSEWPDDYVEEKGPRYNKLETKHFENKECLIMNYSRNTKAFYKVEVSNKIKKELITIEMEYPNISVEQTNAETLLNNVIKGLKFK